MHLALFSTLFAGVGAAYCVFMFRQTPSSNRHIDYQWEVTNDLNSEERILAAYALLLDKGPPLNERFDRIRDLKHDKAASLPPNPSMQCHKIYPQRNE